MTRLSVVTVVAASLIGLPGFTIAPIQSAQGAEAASVNDTARFLAGMPPSAGSPLAALTKDQSWQQHAKTMDKAFATVEKSPLSQIRAWSSANLKSPQATMFYMFSGPDFLFADAFFPQATTYVMAGLEPTGDIPDLMKSHRRGGIAGLGHLENSMRTLLSLSFFITVDMREKLNESALRGTIPILYVFLARSGKQLRDASMVYIDSQGDVHPEDKKAKSGARGVKIVFAGSDGRERTLYYFVTNLDNAGTKASGFLKFLDKLGPADSFHKSASYLMHGTQFTRIRDFIVAKSATVVQDDSGIPFRFFDQKEWELRPFGQFPEAMGIFPEGYQPKYRDLFRKGRAGKLDFGIGYRHRIGESNLLLAVKRAKAAALH
jgi:hypothetical protein